MASIQHDLDQPQPGAEAPVMPTAIKWAGISFAVSVAFQLLSYVLGWSDPANAVANAGLATIIGLLGFAITIVIIFLGLKAYRDGANAGWLTLGQAVKWSLIFGLVSGVLGLIWTLIFYNVIAPDFLTDMQDAQLDMMEERGSSEAEIEQARTISGYTSTPLTMGGIAFFGSVILSLIIGAILGLILRTSGPRGLAA